MATAYLIINGKKAGLPEIRTAVIRLRSEGHDLHIRITWEYGDAIRYVNEAVSCDADVVIAGGGDGTVNELAHALASIDQENVPTLGILPLGSANDFATSCNIPAHPYIALKLALTARPERVDLVRVNNRFIINVASAGFGAAVTADTPPELKNFLAGGAYTLMGLIKILNLTSYPVQIKCDQFEFEGDALIGAICNGRQAGGGQILSPNGYINDGLFELLLAKPFPILDIDQVISEIRKPSPTGKYVVSVQGRWLESYSNAPIPLNLDGEPMRCNNIRFEMLAGAIKLALPKDCPCIKR